MDRNISKIIADVIKNSRTQNLYFTSRGNRASGGRKRRLSREKSRGRILLLLNTTPLENSVSGHGVNYAWCWWLPDPYFCISPLLNFKYTTPCRYFYIPLCKTPHIQHTWKRLFWASKPTFPLILFIYVRGIIIQIETQVRNMGIMLLRLANNWFLFCSPLKTSQCLFLFHCPCLV